MNKNTKLQNTLIASAIAIVGAGLIIILLRQSIVSSQSSALDEFAKCLADKDATMYGAEWCPHCQNEKKAFGGSFRFIPYIECPKEPDICIQKQVQGYPTWIFSDGSRFEGEQGLERLSTISGCSLPALE